MSRLIFVFVVLLLPRGAYSQWSTLYGAAREEARHISSSSLAVPLSPDQWQATVERRREMWREMIGLSPLPPRSPLNATVTGTLERGDYVVEKVHFQCLPGAYVVGNLYRPAKPTGKLPAVLYLCGHTKGKVNTPYQANPRWFGSTAMSHWFSTRSSSANRKDFITEPPAAAAGIGTAAVIHRGNRSLERDAGTRLLGNAAGRGREPNGRDRAQWRRCDLMVSGRSRRTGEVRGSRLPIGQYRACGHRSRDRWPLRLCLLG